MNFSGVMPACVTPFDQNGQIDTASLAQLFSYFRSCGCSGVVVAGTNGEGPSLSAVEKRDLVRAAVPMAEGINVVLGVATPSLPEAIWLAEQAGKSGAAAILLMAPSYFRSASEQGIVDWFSRVADASPIPVIAYNFPKFTGFTFSESVVTVLAQQENICGFKDSSSEIGNLEMFRSLAPDASLMIGDETLLHDALKAGWQGTISGAANLVPQWLVRVVERFGADKDDSETAFAVLKPVVESIRQGPQPATIKSVLAHWGIVSNADVRLPLSSADGCEVWELIESRLGLRRENLGIPKRNYLV
ncbi:MAG: dihydrodipicolinate synthase family protein [Fimbriimonadaceae bacterium]